MAASLCSIRLLFASIRNHRSFALAVLAVLANALGQVGVPCAEAQTVESLNAPFVPITQSSVTYGQGVVADAANNLYITGTTNLLYLSRNADGSYTPAGTKIDSTGGIAYGLAIDPSNNLYRPDINPGSSPNVAKYTYTGVSATTGAAYTKTTLTASSFSWSGITASSVAVDSNYNVYVLDSAGGQILKFTPTSASLATYTEATIYQNNSLKNTTGLSCDSNGNFYVASGSTTGNNTGSTISSTTDAVYKLIPSGSSTPVTATYILHSLGSSWNSPAATAVDSTGTVWVADYGAQKIYELIPASNSATETSYTKQLYPSSTSFVCLRTLTVSKTGQLFGLESSSTGCTANAHAVPEVGGTAPHNSGTPTVGGTPTTQEVDVTYSGPPGTAHYSVTNQGVSTSDGFSDTTPSSGSTGGGISYCKDTSISGNSCAVTVEFSPTTPGLHLGAVVFTDVSGNVLATDYLYGVGYAAEATLQPSTVTTFATANESAPGAMVADIAGNIYVADAGSNRVLKITAGGSTSTVAGNGTASTSEQTACGGGAAATSVHITPAGVAVDGAGNLFISDATQNRICEVAAATGDMTLLAGTGTECSSSTATCGDGGAASGANLALGVHSSLAVDGLGNLLIADTGDNRIRAVNLTAGTISTVVGTGTACSPPTATCGDGALGTLGELNAPTGVYVDSLGDYLIADTGDNRIRSVAALTGNLSTVAGTGSAGNSGDGAAATSAELDAPNSVAADTAGDIYINDTGNNRVRVVAYATGDITASVGGGTEVPAQNPVPAANAVLSSPSGFTIDSNGNLFIADTGAGVVEKIAAISSTLRYPTATATGTTDATDGTQTVTLLNTGNLTLTHVSPNLTAPVDFTQVTGSGSDCTSSFSLAQGASCNIRVNFHPVSAGTLSESFTITDNALGLSSTTQTIALSGTGLEASGDTTATTLTAFPASIVNGGTVTLTATVSDVSVPASTPSGTVALTDQLVGGSAISITGGTVTLTGGVATLSGVTLAGAGTHTITATYPGASGYDWSSGTFQVTVGNSSAVGTPSSSYPVTVTITTAGTVASINVVTQGATGLDFTNAGGGSCNATDYSQNATCTVNVTFTPMYPGTRFGAVVLKDSENNVLGTAYISGMGSAPMVGFAPAAQSTLKTGFSSPQSVAEDASGNIFFADTGNNAVKEMLAPSYTTIHTLGSGFNNPYSVALDGAGNVFVADFGNGVVKEIVAAGDYTTVNTLAGLPSAPCGVAVDGSGNVFATACGGTKAVEEILAAGGYSTVNTLYNGSGINDPIGLALDASSNIFVANFGNSTIIELQAANGYASAVSLGGSFSFARPAGVAVDNNGNVFVADDWNSAVEEIMAAGGYTTVHTLGSGFSYPFGLTLDQNGNVLIADTGNNAVKKLDYADAPSLSYATSTTVGSTDTTDGASGVKTVQVLNAGNATLNFGASGVTSPTDFFVASGGGVCADSGTVTAGGSCTLPIEFAPYISTTPGVLSENLTLTDNSLNADAAQQLIALSGTAAAVPSDATSMALTISASTVVSGGTVTLTATVTDTDNSGNTPTGTVNFTDTMDNTLASCTLSAGTCTSAAQTLNGLGSDNITAAYAGAEGFASSSGTSTVVVMLSSTAGTPTSSTPVTVTLPSGGTVGGVSVVTQGLTGQDFMYGGSDTCNGNTFGSSGTCAVSVIFTPKYPGMRYGAIVLKDGEGNVLSTTYISGVGTGPVAALEPGTIATVAGNASVGSDDSVAATGATLDHPYRVIVDPAGSLIIADTWNNAIRKVTGTTITTLAGTPGSTEGYAGDGSLATDLSVQLDNPRGIALDGAGNLYIADTANSVIRMVSAATGKISTVAGANYSFSDTSFCQYSGDDGAATSAQLCVPSTVLVDGLGNLYIADTGNSVIRKVAASNKVISTIAGDNNSMDSYGGDGQLAASPGVGLYAPDGLAMDGADNLYIADAGNQVIRKVAASTGQISTVAGKNSLGSGYSGDGDTATNAQLNWPSGLALDVAGNLYIADNSNYVIRRVMASDQTISTVAGNNINASDSLIGDNGPATGAELDYPRGVAMDGAGNLYIADFYDNAIRKVSATAASLDFPTSTPWGTIDSSDGAETITVDNIGNANLIFTESGLTAPVDFAQTAGSCADSGSVAANASCTVSIKFEPQSVGAKSESFVLSDNSLNAAPATQLISLSGTASKATPTISINNIPSSAVYNGSFTPLITYNGDGTASFVSNTSSVCFPYLGTVYFVGVGSCSLTASATAGTNYAAIAGTAQTFSIGQATPTISISNVPSSAVYLGSFTPSISYSGDGTASFISNSTGICSVVSGVVHFVGVGTCSLTASATAGTNYAAIAGTAQTFSIGQATPTISISNVPSSAVYLGSFTPSITYVGDGTASFISNSPTICSVASGVVHFIALGTCSLTASATAGTNYIAAPGVPQAFIIGTATATVTLKLGSLTQIYTGSPLSATATTDPADLTVTFTYTGTNGTTYGPSTTPPVNVGSYTVSASVRGDYTGTASGTMVIVPAFNNLNANAAGLVFGSMPVGAVSPAQTLILTNLNNTAATVTSISASGDFSAASNCPTIAATGTCSVNVTFAPSTTGARAGTLTVTIAQLNAPQTFSLSGIGTAPGILVTPTVVNFGSQVLSTTSAGQSITIANTGTANLILSNIVTSGDFSTSSNCASVPAGSNCNLTVTFTPTATGVRAGTITFTDNVGSGDENQTVSLSGMGTVAGATLTPSALNFPATVVGATSYVLDTTLTNTGTASLTGISIAALGDFTQTNNCAATLAPAATCTIAVTYAPTVAGVESGSLNLSDNLGTQTVSLLGTGLVPGASLSAAQLIFGGQLLNTSSKARTVVFTNTGSAAVVIDSVTATANFDYTSNCSGSIAAGASCGVNVVFKPTATGALSGTITIVDGVGTQVITAQGQGVSPGLSVTPSFAIFGAQVVGTTSPAQTLTATNTGTVALNLNPIQVSGNFTESDQCPATLQPGASCLISLSFAPTATGSLSGSLVVSDSAGLASTLVAVSGQGTLPGISTTPATLSFGSQPVGIASQAQTVTVTNTGTSSLQIGSILGMGDFAETDNCAHQTIAAGGYCILNVTMTPTTIGTRTGSIQINDNADGAHLIALSGMGQQAGATVAPTSLSFGSLPFVASTQLSLSLGTPLSVTLTNTGNTALQLGGFTTQGDFTESDSCGASVAVGASCTLTVTFVPTALGHRTGTLTITDNAGGGTQSVSLEGVGSPAGLTLLPPVLNFGVQTVGVTSNPLTATLTNNMGVAISDLQITPSGEYGESDNCGGALANLASCTLSITVTPATAGAITGTIEVSGVVSNSILNQSIDRVRAELPRMNGAAGSGSTSFSLGMVAVSATSIPPGIGFSIPTLSFTATSVGTPSSGETVTITNTGTVLSLTHLTASETNAAEFPFVNNCPATLAAQATCTIVIQFTPAQMGLRSGSLNIAADNGIAASLPESGTAVAGVSQLAFGTAPASNIALNGNAGSSITVMEENSSAATIPTAIDSIKLVVTGPGYLQSYTATAAAGIAAFDLSGVPLTTAGGYTYMASIVASPSVTYVVAAETVGQAASSVTLTSSANPAMVQNQVTFTATVSSVAGTPTGSVNFMVGSTPLGSGTLVSGVATLVTTTLATGSDTITAVYQGDTNFLGSSTTGALSESILDFTLSAGVSSGGSAASQTVQPGGAANYIITIAPTTGTQFPILTTLTLTGLPAGATATLNTTPWTQLTSTSWQLPANTKLADVSLTFNIPAQTAALRGTDASQQRIPPLLWGALLLPFAVRLRRVGKRMSRAIRLLLLLAGATTMIAVSGCGARNGFFSQPQQSYTVTVTVTTGTLSHSTNLTLNVE